MSCALIFSYLAIPQVFVSSSTNFFITASVELGLSSGKTMTVILLFMNALSAWLCTDN